MASTWYIGLPMTDGEPATGDGDANATAGLATGTAAGLATGLAAGSATGLSAGLAAGLGAGLATGRALAAAAAVGGAEVGTGPLVGGVGAVVEPP
jgi:hypothetical protein